MHAEQWVLSIQFSMEKSHPICVHPVFKISYDTEPNSPLANILQKAKNMNTPERVELLENSDDLEAAHTSFSQHGQSHAPGADESVETHYIALVKHVNPKTGKTMIYELDGRRLGPVEREELPKGEDLLGPAALKIVQEFMTREMESGKQEFSLCALAPNLD
jgi:ubiquitin carboxyl-terminal hydrolase L3